MKQNFCPDTASRPRAGRPKAAPSQSPRVTRAARPRINRNGSGATPPARPSSASRSKIGVANLTRRPVFRIGPPDRAKIHGDVAHVRPRGTDSLRDDAFAINPASRRGGDRLGADDDRGLPRWQAAPRGPRRPGGAKQCSLVTRRAVHVAILATSRVIGKAKSGPARMVRARAQPDQPVSVLT